MTSALIPNICSWTFQLQTAMNKSGGSFWLQLGRIDSYIRNVFWGAVITLSQSIVKKFWLRLIKLADLFVAVKRIRVGILSFLRIPPLRALRFSVQNASLPWVFGDKLRSLANARTLLHYKYGWNVLGLSHVSRKGTGMAADAYSRPMLNSCRLFCTQEGSCQPDYILHIIISSNIYCSIDKYGTLLNFRALR